MFKRAMGLTVAMLGVALTAPAVAQSAAVCRAHGQAALEAWTQGRYDQVGKHFAPGIAAKLTPEMLRQVWGQVQTQAGSFKSLGALAPQSLGGQEALVARMEFSRTALAAVIHCDAQDRIDGFRVVPATLVEKAAAAPESAIPGAVSKALPVPTPLGALPGTLTLPEGKGPFPAVLLVAGSGPHDEDETVGPNKPFRDLAAGLAKAGIATLRYDKRTYVYGAQMAGKSITVDDEVTDDALAAARLLARQPGIDPHRVFVLGHSLGALMAPRIGQRDPHLAGLILLGAPASFGLDTLVRQMRYIGGLKGTPTAELDKELAPVIDARNTMARANPARPPEGSFLHAPASYWLSLRDYNAVTVAKSLHMPMLVLQGGGDYQVTPKGDFVHWQAAFAHSQRVQLKEYPGLSHLFMPAGQPPSPADLYKPGHVDARVIDDVARWIKAQPAHS
ncbi:alpha/beta fold hydrolase [Rhodanobacter glycinis]|uniref:Alpha/beta fold hydrolase n=1 Tax=Rhodanobacter glycinis TaxID=582702 RepID=A0A5B9DY79_9GAMM|nr:alpha/beta fold hydrolase [Rhodanobacter glycinis]QEE24114.1 alpha/beta fold hydrolase [Rhodanobacter glycinis]